MTNQNTEWHAPLSPWQVVRQRFFAGRTPGAGDFARKHGLNEESVRQVFAGETELLSREICLALSRETSMSQQFFLNLNDQHQRVMA